MNIMPRISPVQKVWNPIWNYRTSTKEQYTKTWIFGKNKWNFGSTDPLINNIITTSITRTIVTTTKDQFKQNLDSWNPYNKLNLGTCTKNTTQTMDLWNPSDNMTQNNANSIFKKGGHILLQNRLPGTFSICGDLPQPPPPLIRSHSDF